VTPPDDHQPVFVTFASGARLLVSLGIDPAATAQGLRHLARTAEDWPFGPGRPHDYIYAGTVRTMETGVFLDYFQKHPRTHRGRDKQPRRKRGERR
jgi:hypothetical protein